MLETPGRPQRPDSLRRLNLPRRIAVEAGADGTPLAVQHRGRRQRVARVQELYRTDDRWWTAEPVARSYFHLLLEGELTLTIFHDEIRDKWYAQRGES